MASLFLGCTETPHRFGPSGVETDWKCGFTRSRLESEKKWLKNQVTCKFHANPGRDVPYLFCKFYANEETWYDRDVIHENFHQLILWRQNCARKSVESKKSHGDHKAIEHGLENRLDVFPISSSILRYTICKNSVISCFQVLKSVSESKSNSWFHGVHLYDSTFNWKGLEALTKTWQKRPRSWLSETCWSCFTLLSVLVAVLAKVWDLRQSETKRDFPDPFILG